MSNNRVWDFSGMSYPLHESIIKVIRKTFIPLYTSTEYKLIRNLTNNGLFIAKSAYTFIDSNWEPVGRQEDHFRWVCKLNVSNKVKCFTWLLYHNRLPTSQYLHHISLNINPNCSFCEVGKKDILNIFFECPSAKHFWKNLSNGCTNQVRIPFVLLLSVLVVIYLE